MKHTRTIVRKHHHLNVANPHEWLKDAVRIEGQKLERIRKIPQKWSNKSRDWKPFPDAGIYQMTKLTRKLTHGSCNAYYIKLRAGEEFPVHKHPNAVHIMIGVKGAGSICWRDSKNTPKYYTTIKPGAGVFAITPETEHAILADRKMDLVFLVINAPAEKVEASNYQVHIRNSRRRKHFRKSPIRHRLPYRPQSLL